MEKQLKLDSHHRVTAERVFRHPTSHNIQWHDVLSLLESFGEGRETTKGSYELKVDETVHLFAAPLGRDLNDRHVVEVRKILRQVGITPEALNGA